MNDDAVFQMNRIHAHREQARSHRNGINLRAFAPTPLALSLISS